jgi:glycerophosphoryl diester phosphodiesterase
VGPGWPRGVARHGCGRTPGIGQAGVDETERVLELKVGTGVFSQGSNVEALMMTIRSWIALALVAGSMFATAGSLVAQEKWLVFAHRGGSREFDENTLAAFRGSYEKGLRGFETDVRMTKDGELVILHDNSLDRTFNASGAVEQKMAAELGGITTRKSGQPMLFLKDLLAYFADKPGVYLELEMKTSDKALYPETRLKEYCRKLDEAARRKPQGSFYVFTSFDERSLKTMKAVDAHADLLLIVGEPCSAKVVARAKALGVNRVGCLIEGTSRAAVREAQKAGLRVSVWPGGCLQDYYLAVGLGADAICTDIPVAIFTWKARIERQAP